jgi:hypothetical protein
MRLSEIMKNWITSSDIPEPLPAFVMVCQKWDDHICQRCAEQAVQNNGGRMGLASPWTPPRLKAPEMSPAQSDAGYTGLMPTNLSPGEKRISAEELAKRFAKGRCLYCGGFNHRAAECAAWKQPQAFKTTGAEVKDVGFNEECEELGKDQAK